MDIDGLYSTCPIFDHGQRQPWGISTRNTSMREVQIHVQSNTPEGPQAMANRPGPFRRYRCRFVSANPSAGSSGIMSFRLGPILDSGGRRITDRGPRSERVALSNSSDTGFIVPQDISCLVVGYSESGTPLQRPTPTLLRRWALTPSMTITVSTAFIDRAGTLVC